MDTMEKTDKKNVLPDTFALPADVLALNHATAKNESRVRLLNVFFDHDNIVASDGHILAVKTRPDNVAPGFEGALNLKGVKAPKKEAEVVFCQVAGGKHYSEHGTVSVAEVEIFDYKSVLPTVSPETHHIFSIDAELLVKLAKVLNSGETGPTRGIVRLFVKKDDQLAAIGVEGFDPGTIGVIMPCRAYQNEDDKAEIFENYQKISGKHPVEEDAK